jgi:hypothetical protein
VLDEIYSVDIEGAALKKSFGTALKLFDYQKLGTSAFMGAAFAALLAAAPPMHDFQEIVRPPVLFSFLKEHLLPKGDWFGIKPAETTAALDSAQGAGAKTP